MNAVRGDAPKAFLFFQQCLRCGIEFGVEPWSRDEFCVDCDYPDHTKVFYPDDYSWLFKKGD